jgi:hypothetical protein
MMEKQRTRQSNEPPAAAAEGPAPPGGSSLAQQAHGYAEAARRARAQCQQGQAAEQELHKRRNRSGQ